MSEKAGSPAREFGISADTLRDERGQSKLAQSTEKALVKEAYSPESMAWSTPSGEPKAVERFSTGASSHANRLEANGTLPKCTIDDNGSPIDSPTQAATGPVA